MEKAHDAAVEYINYAVKFLAGLTVRRSSLYVTWFESALFGNTPRLSNVQKKFADLYTDVTSLQITYEWDPPYCDSIAQQKSIQYQTTITALQLSAGVPRNSKSKGQVFMCYGGFRPDVPFMGKLSLAGVLVHELTHLMFQSVDHAYDDNSLKQLAKSDPDKAINNAKTYQRFCESLLGQDIILQNYVGNTCSLSKAGDKLDCTPTSKTINTFICAQDMFPVCQAVNTSP